MVNNVFKKFRQVRYSCLENEVKNLSKKSQTEETELYLGSWELIPELCLYEKGNAPCSGTYGFDLHQAQHIKMVFWFDRSVFR